MSDQTHPSGRDYADGLGGSIACAAAERRAASALDHAIWGARNHNHHSSPLVPAIADYCAAREDMIHRGLAPVTNPKDLG